MKRLPIALLLALSTSVGVLGYGGALAATSEPTAEGVAVHSLSVAAIAKQLKVGDVVFIRIDAKPFREVADATDSWTNHVGVVVEVSGSEPLIGESKFPWSRTTPLSDFIARSESRRIAVARLEEELTPEQERLVAAAARQRNGVLYDTGFDLHSTRQFCSRYVHEVLLDATGIRVGDVETFSHLLESRPGANVRFWKVWFFGRIPWSRETVTPASLLRSRALKSVFDGVAQEAQGSPQRDEVLATR